MSVPKREAYRGGFSRETVSPGTVRLILELLFVLNLKETDIQMSCYPSHFPIDHFCRFVVSVSFVIDTLTGKGVRGSVWLCTVAVSLDSSNNIKG